LNSGLITILTGTTITNSSTGAATFTIDGLVVQSGATFLFANGTNYLGSLHTPDMDVYGNFGLQNGNEPLFLLNTGATIVMESGSIMTNNGSAANDNFDGLGYTNGSGYVAGAITFKSGSTYVQQFNGSSAKGWIPHATWQPGSTCLIAPTAAVGFVPKGLPGQTFYDFIWNWPNEVAPGKFGSSQEQGSFAIAHNFYMTASGPTCTNNDVPNAGYSLTVGGNIGLTNVAWVPAGSAGVLTLNVGGNLIVDSTAVIKVNNGSAVGNVTFNGSSPQTLGMHGVNGSPGGWTWTVNSGSTVNLDSPLTVNYGDAGAAGAITVNGTLNFTANAALSGSSNTITLGGAGAQFNISAASGAWTFAAEDTLEGSGTVVGAVTASSTSVILPGSLSAGATLTFDGSLTYGGAASTNIFTLNSSPGSAGNSQIVVSGGPGSILHPNGAQIVINPIGTLSTSTSYLLYNVTGGGTVSASTFAPALAWVGTPPGNAAQFNIATNAAGTQVYLQFGTPVPQPDITSVSASGATSPTNLTVNINNAVSGTPYTVLMSTSLTAPLTSWTTVGSFTPGSSGSYSATITGALNPSDPAQYFVLRAP
jgi:hypothetical protein